MIDNIFETFMSQQNRESILCAVWGTGKGSGAAMLMAVLGAAGVAVCVIYSFLLKREIFDKG